MREISDNFREYQNLSFLVDQLQMEVEKAREKSDRMKNQLQDLISKAAFSYVTLKNPKVSANMLFKASQSSDPALQAEATDAYRL